MDEHVMESDSNASRMNVLMYGNKDNSEARHGAIRGRLGSASVWVAGVLAVVLVVVAGIVYRVLAVELRAVLDTPIKLPVPLSEIPAQIGDWVGHELPIREVERDYMETNFADDFISRRYVNAEQGLWADLYLVYCSSRRGGIIGHQPLVCLPAHGWIWDSTVPSEITSRSGRSIQCLIHGFHKPAPVYQQTVVLSFYVLNGQVTLRESDFSGLLGRMPNLSGDPARYVSQVQISSILEHSVRVAAGDIVDTVLSFLPDQDGHVRATDLINALEAQEGPVEDEQQPSPAGGDSI